MLGAIATGVLKAEEIAVAEARRALAPGFRATKAVIPTELCRRLDEVATHMLAAPAPGPLWSVCGHHERYPSGVGELGDKPLVIYGCGDPDRIVRIGSEPAVAIVGARRASPVGRDITHRMACEMAMAGVSVISGMAYGIDASAHRGALSGGGFTVAVLAGSPTVPYPAAHATLHRELAETGLVVSEHPPGSQMAKWGFPARNRLIAAMSQLTLVVEGRDGSGATHTTDFATQLGRTVAAIPGAVGSPLSALPNALLYDGASLVRDARDLLDLVFGAGQRPLFVKTHKEVPAELVEVLDAVRCGATSVDEVCRQVAELDAIAASRALGRLELIGALRRDERGSYVAVEP